MRARNLQTKRAFTLIELLVVIAIIAILAGLLFPSLARAKEKSKAANCQSNLRQLAMAAVMFDDDHEVYPVGWGAGGDAIWYKQLQPYLGKSATRAGGGVFICPSSMQRARAEEAIKAGTRGGGFWGWLTYAQNSRINLGQTNQGSRSFADPANTIVYADTDGWDACLYPDGDDSVANVCYRHSGGNDRSAGKQRVTNDARKGKFRANAVFADSHVELLRKAPLRLFTLQMD